MARRLLRYRATLAMAAMAALVSALGLGAGLVALGPAIQAILDEDAPGLPQAARNGAASLERFGVRIPDAWFDALPSDRFDALLLIVASLCALTVVGATANFLHSFLAQTLAERVVAGVRRDAFRRVEHMPLRRVLADGPADMVARIVNDAQRLTGGLLSLVDKGPAQVTRGFIALMAAIVLDWRSLAAIPVALVMGTIIRKLGKRVRRASRGAMEAQSALLASTTEALQALRVVKTSAAERVELGRFSRHNREYMRQILRARTAKALASPVLETMGIFVVGAWSLFFAKQIIEHGMDPSKFVAAMIALGVAAGSLKPLTSIVQEIQASKPAAGRLVELLDADVEWAPGGRRRARLARHARDIEFAGVRFTYPGADHPALDGVTLSIRHGETVAFVGGNGSGKTTLISLVPRLFDPDAGAVRIDGRDLREVDLRSLRRQIGVVTQEVALFKGTIASNIAYGAEAATPEKIAAAARLARAEEFILTKPGGYAAKVGEQGVTLSGGQRQRIALARAFLRDPAILLLDEATSMVDAESERQIAAAIGDFAQGRTGL
ncbi:MAG: ABC transporter ATP-binding protein, partial [Phycisphaerales bacterium]|nr:ABC transporter ATP-binding protein [Phycisphaerales bacterium]